MPCVCGFNFPIDFSTQPRELGAHQQVTPNPPKLLIGSTFRKQFPCCIFPPSFDDTTRHTEDSTYRSNSAHDEE